MDKKSTWSVPKIVLSVDKEARTVTIPAKGGRRAVVGIEDLRLAFPCDSFAVAVQEAINNVENSIYDVVDATDCDNESTFPQKTPVGNKNTYENHVVHDADADI